MARRVRRPSETVRSESFDSDPTVSDSLEVDESAPEVEAGQSPAATVESQAHEQHTGLFNPLDSQSKTNENSPGLYQPLESSN